jgi:hypothetical protein
MKSRFTRDLWSINPCHPCHRPLLGAVGVLCFRIPNTPTVQSNGRCHGSGNGRWHGLILLLVLCVASCSEPRPAEPPREPPANGSPTPPTQPVPTAPPPSNATPTATPAPTPTPAPEKPSPTPTITEKAPPPVVEDPPPVKAPVEVAADEYREVFPNVRVNAKARAVQFDGIVPIDAHSSVKDDKNPLQVFLEVTVCTPDTKEHEAIVVTKAKPSHVHAALLLIGLQPGSPGKWVFENGKLKPIAPRGDEVVVTISYTQPDGKVRMFSPQDMIVDVQTGKRLGEATPGGAGGAGRWLFAGSQLIKRQGTEVYDADGAGTLIGLTTFGSETIAWSEVISPEAAVQEPAWIARAETVPPAGATVTVTITPGPSANK